MFFDPDTFEESRAYLRTVLDAQSVDPRSVWELAVVESSTARMIGACDLTLEESDQADLGYILSREAWGRGYATEMARALLDRGFSDLGLRRMFATCDRENDASRRVLTKAGLLFDSVLNRHKYARDRWWDSELYAISRGDWLASKEEGA